MTDKQADLIRRARYLAEGRFQGRRQQIRETLHKLADELETLTSPPKVTSPAAAEFNRGPPLYCPECGTQLFRGGHRCYAGFDENDSPRDFGYDGDGHL